MVSLCASVARSVQGRQGPARCVRSHTRIRTSVHSEGSPDAVFSEKLNRLPATTSHHPHINESSHNREADGCVGKHNKFHTTSTNLEEEPLRLLDSNKKTAKKGCKGIPKGTLVFVSVHSTGFASDDTIADQTSLPRLPTGESIWAPLAPALPPFQERRLQFFPK